MSKSKDTNISLEKLHQLAMDNKLAFASYRLPGSHSPTTMLQWQKPPQTITNLADLAQKQGFVFAPFDEEAKYPPKLIVPDLVINSQASAEGDQGLEIFDDSAVTKTNDLDGRKNAYHEASKEEYISQVESAMQAINLGTLQKIVVSRISSSVMPADFNSSLYFQALQKAYPEAFVFMVYMPETGLWIGASPEPLIRVKNNTVHTVSLAGTRTVDKSRQQKKWGEKELFEQKLVTQYIENIIHDFNIPDYEKHGPVSHVAGSVEHLKTAFSFPLDRVNDKIHQFLGQLHPTPSVCGLPKNKARQQIRETEKHDRAYYTGFMGPMNVQDEWALFVNLRSMKVHNNKLYYYLGAGITHDSVPENEWEETINKKKTLQRIVESL